MSRMILGLVGRKRTGKDTIAAHLVAEHGFTRLAFADPVRELALGLDPIVLTYQDLIGTTVEYRLSEAVSDLGWEEAKEHPEVRRTLQRIGTQGVREVLGQDVWVATLYERMLDLLRSGNERIVITDVRFPNEARLVRDLGHLVGVKRSTGILATDRHVSETNVDSIATAHTIYNDGSIEELHDTVDFLLQEIDEREEASA